MGFFGKLFGGEGGPSKEEMGVDTSYSESNSSQAPVADVEAAINVAQQEGMPYNDALTQVQDQQQVNQMVQAGVPTQEINQALEDKGYQPETTSPESNPIAQDASVVEHAAPQEDLTPESVAKEMAEGGVNIVSSTEQVITPAEVVDSTAATEASETSDVIAAPDEIEQSLASGDSEDNIVA